MIWLVISFCIIRFFYFVVDILFFLVVGVCFILIWMGWGFWGIYGWFFGCFGDINKEKMMVFNIFLNKKLIFIKGGNRIIYFIFFFLLIFFDN